MEKILYIVHCVDTEGPLYESLQATAERIENTFGLKYNLTKKKLEGLQKGIDVPDKYKKVLMDFISPERLNYKTTWEEIDEMLNEILNANWRDLYKDDFGNGYIFNWFILDHVGFKINPRRRALGYHCIYEHYKEKFNQFNVEDKIYWHYHPTSFHYEAHKTSNNFSFTNEHLQILSRRLIDKLDFPVAFRPGCHTERPDINLFLELWIPFDYGNQGMDEREEDRLQKDLSDGRYGDWRRATSEWEIYHPDFYDYQKKGNMKRYIARCLNLGSRIRPITKDEIEKAFKRVNNGKNTILSVTNHDEREMRKDIDWFMKTVRNVQKKYKDVKICHTDAVNAIRNVENLKFEKPTKLRISWDNNKISITADKSIWGPQPYFCFKTKDKRYIHENLDYHGGLHWSYVFDENTITLDAIEKIGLATNDNYGNTSNYVIETKDKKIISKFRNE